MGMRRRWVLACSLAFLVVLVRWSFSPGGFSDTALAQDADGCFRETGYCIDGRIRKYWEQNGGLPVFGYPITEQRVESIEGKDIEVQWFERNRLELHPENDSPDDVLLGRLGEDVLIRQGFRWEEFPKAKDGADCVHDSITDHSICNEYGFRSYWQHHGGLTFFGRPLSEEVPEVLSDGRIHIVQWFERARFEWHPEHDKVLLGLLGNEIIKEPRKETFT